MQPPGSPSRPPALVVGGMHRSGTSLLASLLAAAGVHLGETLVAATAGNSQGHFEDVDFHLLLRRILAANGLPEEGFTCAERIVVPPPCRAEAAALVERRRSAGRPWGWKDPRTVLFLDFWADLLPESRWLFVVRPPWEVVDSLYRRGDAAFRADPRFAADVWVAYNRRILDFVRARPDRTAVVHSRQVIADPAGVVRLAAELAGAPLQPPPARFREGSFVTEIAAHRAALVQAANPAVRGVYRELLEHSRWDRDPGVTEAASGESAAAAAGMIEWSTARAALAERDEQCARLQAECAALAAQLDAERGIYESMRRDMMAQITSFRTGRRRAG